MSDTLITKQCKACEGMTEPLAKEAVIRYLEQTPGWEVDPDFKKIQRVFHFKNYFRTMAFLNVIAYIAHQENHHPDMEVSYNRLTVVYQTHAIGGLSENDFICAAKVNQI